MLSCRIMCSVLLFTLTTSAAAPEQPSTGTKIGTVVKDAISAALPGVGQILSLIWPSGKENAKKNKTEAASDPNTTQNVDKLKAQLLSQAKERLKPVEATSAELGVVHFLQYQYSPPSTFITCSF